MRIRVTSIPVQDQEQALTFYTGTLRFVKRHDIPPGQAQWLTVVSPEEPDGVELLLEPNGNYPVPSSCSTGRKRPGLVSISPMRCAPIR